MTETIKTEPEAETEKRDRGSDREAQLQTLEVTETIKTVTERDRLAHKEQRDRGSDKETDTVTDTG